MKWPATAEELKAEGYRDEKRSKWCSCGEVIFWFMTPGGKFIPLGVEVSGRYVPHHSTCKNVRDFRAADNAHRERVEGRRPKQESLFHGEIK